ncbi:MAG: hypothetical protein ABI954_11800, partial [Pyrinomonadaceae bacterium]
MYRNLLNLQLLLILFLLLFSQAFAQNAPIKLRGESTARLVTVSQNSPQQITPFRFNFSETIREKRFWYSIKNSSNAADFRLFLEQFPNSVFAKTAASKLEDLNEKSKLALPISENLTLRNLCMKLEATDASSEKPRVKLENTKA